MKRTFSLIDMDLDIEVEDRSEPGQGSHETSNPHVAIDPLLRCHF